MAMRTFLLPGILLLAASVSAQTPLGTAFTYQGLLKNSGLPSTGLFDFQACVFHDPANPLPLFCAADMPAIPVESGLFGLSLDFGPGVFAGSERYLELRLRPAGSGMGYTILSPRQLITPAPEAMRSASASSAPWGGLTGVPAGFADGIDDGGGGTVTSITTGPGLTGGPITGTGQISIANGGVQNIHLAPNSVFSAAIINASVTSAKIGGGAVGLTQINTAQVQARVSGSCEIGTYLIGVNADGSVECAELPGATSIGTLTSSALSNGEFMAIAIGNDGIPMVSYSEFNTGAFVYGLKLARCVNPSCMGLATIRVIDVPAGSVGLFNDIAIGADGNPVMSYHDGGADSLKVAACTTPDCSGSITITTVDDPANQVGRYTSIAIGNDGRPVISYRDDTSASLKVAKCANAACTGSATITTIDNPTNQVGAFSSIAVGQDGLPVISYYDASAFRLKVAKCTNASCTGATISFVPYSGNNNGQYSSIAVDVSGAPVISYHVLNAGALEVTKCLNLDCSDAVFAQVDNPVNSVGSHTSLALPEDGKPVISYYDATAQALKVAKCANASCSGTSTVTTIDDSAYNVGQPTAIAIGADGFPVIAYRDVTNEDVKIAKCGTRSCR